MSAHAWQLERIDPAPHRGERVRLAASAGPLRIGRSRRCEITLYSATASREHAMLEHRADGSWWLTPCEGKVVWADGEPVTEPIELCEGLALQLGKDQLRCRGPAEVGAPAQAEAEPEIRPRRSALGLLVVLGVALALLGAVALLSSR